MLATGGIIARRGALASFADPTVLRIPVPFAQLGPRAFPIRKAVNDRVGPRADTRMFPALFALLFAATTHAQTWNAAVNHFRRTTFTLTVIARAARASELKQLAEVRDQEGALSPAPPINRCGPCATCRWFAASEF
jgi:hypothetical protein